ncbi:S-formylglutathione hydrolase [Parahaliea mediterranea]|uniref:S-formylglutathione hydrolase n=1 Tax=Parahaliea mediterranea TaxID=651086 RepID=A0A939DH12_9GAMM|nr:S-formylglutathione hydrolase [Parahaliea mediterranea]MBN7798113.1 S-formylglutathione hydrolase [Parahaliea mediterranea]
METIANNRCFEGEQLRLAHRAESLGCDMHFSLYLPPGARAGNVPLLYWLSGLTCTDENFVQKAGAQRYAAEHGVAIVAPDTSPRGDEVADDPEGAWDFGLGAGFYVNATEAPWSRHYRMYDYISEELPALLARHFPVDTERASIFGHSMGGHGALVIALRNPAHYQSVSAFAPIVAPTRCPWGEKALGHYLGPDREAWKNYDTCELIRAGALQLPMLVDQGEADNFLEEQLKTELLEATCADTGYEATIRRQPGYDHSYFFISSFIGSHIAFHARELEKSVSDD